MAGIKISALVDTQTLDPTSQFPVAWEGATKSVQQYVVNRMFIQGPAYAATITPDARYGGLGVAVTNTTAFTVAAPINPPDGFHTQFYFMEFQNSSGGVMGAITWNAVYLFAGITWVNPANTKKRSILWQSNGGNSWVARQFTSADY